MLGITVPDAIALGTLILAVLAALKGGKAGEAAKKANPPDPPMALLGASIVDSTALGALTASNNELADAIAGLTAAVASSMEERRKSREGRMLEVLERLSERLEEAEHDRRHTGRR